MAKTKSRSSKAAYENAVKTVLTNIRFAEVDDPVRVICVTSSVPQEGKTQLSIELARSIAAGGKSVLLIEGDMRCRSVASRLRVRPPAHGIYSVLARQASADQAITCVAENMFFMDAEPSIPNPADVLSSRRFAELLAALKRTYDYVIVDTPPVGTFVDGTIVSSLADGTVFAVRQDHARRDEIADAFAQLTKGGGRILGAVMTFCKEDKNESSNYYYYYADKASKQAGDAKPGKAPRNPKAAGHSHRAG